MWLLTLGDFRPKLPHFVDRWGWRVGWNTDQPTVPTNPVAQHDGYHRAHASDFIRGANAVDRFQRHRRLTKVIDDGGHASLEHLRCADARTKMDSFPWQRVEASPHRLPPAVHLQGVTEACRQIFGRVRVRVRQPGQY